MVQPLVKLPKFLHIALGLDPVSKSLVGLEPIMLKLFVFEQVDFR